MKLNFCFSLFRKSIKNSENLTKISNCRQRQLEEERNLKLKQLSDARERQKREIQENKMRRVQLAESCDFFRSKVKFDFFFQICKFSKNSKKFRCLCCFQQRFVKKSMRFMQSNGNYKRFTPIFNNTIFHNLISFLLK